VTRSRLPGSDEATGRVKMGTHADIDYFYDFGQERWVTEVGELRAETRPELFEQIRKMARKDFRRFQAILAGGIFLHGAPRIVTITGASENTAWKGPQKHGHEYWYSDPKSPGSRQKSQIETFCDMTPDNLAIVRRIEELQAKRDELHDAIKEEEKKFTPLGWFPNGKVDDEQPLPRGKRAKP
jgi:hypothetical protein